MITIKEIADQLGVSATTVSNVLNWTRRKNVTGDQTTCRRSIAP